MCDLPALTLKGVIEQGDPAAYFGVTLTVQHYARAAVVRGWLAEVQTPAGPCWQATIAGIDAYEATGLNRLPRKGSGSSWDWNGYTYVGQMAKSAAERLCRTSMERP